MEETIQESKDKLIERTTTIGWNELSEILEKASEFISGEKLKK